MKYSFYIIICIVFFGCQPKNGTSYAISENTDTIKMQFFEIKQNINNYLDLRKIQPLLVFRNDYDYSYSQIDICNNKISWEKWQNTDIIQFTININGKTIIPANHITENIMYCDENKDSVDFPNAISEIKYYEIKNLGIDTLKLLSFKLRYYIGIGIGCGVEYQLLYDLNTGQETYFGKYRGYDIDLLEFYEFNNDCKIDFLSQTYCGNFNPYDNDTVLYKYVIFSRNENGKFVENNKYWFKKIYFDNEEKMIFEENWCQKILKSQ
jgi:hypothetical protein